MAQTLPPSSPRTRALTRWREFFRWIDLHSDSRWAFRGLGDESFALIPSVGRRLPFKPADERAVFELFRRHAPELLVAGRLTTLDQLAIAQHHGVPTRLLDWTTNPLVAAYFAVIAPPAPINAVMATETPQVKAVPVIDAVAAKVVAMAIKAPMRLTPDDDPRLH